MNYTEQRKLARELFFGKLPEDVIKVFEDECFGAILRKLKPFREIVLEVIKNIEIPSEWAYRWAKDIGDRKIMRDRVTESREAYRWGRDIGNRKIMRDRVTESGWAYYWARDIGDRKIMRDRITESEWAYY
jgi:hypothetical protein